MTVAHNCSPRNVAATLALLALVCTAGCGGSEAPQPGPRTAAPRPKAAPQTTPDIEPLPEGTYAMRVGDIHIVQVFYATDRAPFPSTLPPWNGWQPFALPAGILLSGVFVFHRWRQKHRFVARIVALVALGVSARMFHAAILERQERLAAARRGEHWYGSQRNEARGTNPLQLGVCEVSIPPDHRVGLVESPSILRLEFSEDPQKHVVLQSVKRLPDDEFFHELRQCVDGSDRKQAFVFIHGYNVAFDDAVRRTAQIAFDLRFDGAAVCYSWPSHGGMASYTRDEANIAWTVLHLEEFLQSLATQSGAKTVHLVAHSMGNRALTQVLERIALRSPHATTVFGQVILAAPDVDADEFRERYAPALRQLARGSTLYASSNDRALAASTSIHGYNRAGLSGEHMLVVPGVETVDASPVDTSVIGHSYYGDNPQLIRDLRAIVDEGLPAENRAWLKKMLRQPDVAWWTFLPDAAKEPEPEL